MAARQLAQSVLFKNIFTRVIASGYSYKLSATYSSCCGRSGDTIHGSLFILNQRKGLSTSQALNERSYDDVNHHVMNYLKELSPSIIRNNSLASQTIPENIEETVKRLIIAIAHNEYVSDCDTIVSLFNLYATHNRPVIQDKSDIPEEFNKMVWKAHQLTKYMSYDELKSFASSLMTLRSQKLNFVDKLIMSVCGECSSRLQKASLNQGIDYFEIILHIFASGMGKKSNYEIFIEFFQNNLEGASEIDLIKLMHYSSFSKNDSQKALVEKSLEMLKDSLPNMSTETLGIISNSVLRGNATLTPNLILLPYVCHSILNTTKKCEKLTVFQKVNFQNMVKLLRLSRFKDVAFVEEFQNTLLNCSSDFFDEEIIPEILAFFAQSFYSEKIFVRLENEFLDILESDSTNLSITEYARVLWAFSHCNHIPSDKFINLIHKDLVSYLKTGRAFRNYAKFSDILYSLAILGRSHPDILRSAITAKSDLLSVGK